VILFSAALLAVGVVLVEARYHRLLLRDRARALRELDRQSVVPTGVRLSAEDHRALCAIRAGTLAEFALGVERLTVAADLAAVPLELASARRVSTG